MRVNVPLARTLGRGVSKAAGMQSLTNMYLEPIKADGRTQFAAYGTPGRTLFSTIGGGLPRGQIRAGDTHYAVVGNALYLVSLLGTTTNLGFIEGTALVDMSFNGVQIDIVTETKTYSFDTLTLALSEIVDANFETASSAASVASYSVYAVAGTGRFRWRLVNTPSFSALDFATAEAEADKLTAVRKVGNQIAMLGSTSLEWWQPTGDAGAFAFGKTQVAAASIGCLSRDAAIVVDNSLFWVGRDGKAGGASVYRADGYQPRKVSTPEVDYYLEQIADLSEIHAITHQELGHQFLVLTVTNEITFALDIATEMWTLRKSGQWSMGSEPTGGWDAVTFALNGSNQIIGAADGNLYKLEHGTYTELGNGIIREITLPQIHNGGKRSFMSRLEVDIEAGVGTGATSEGGNDTYTKSLLTFDGSDGAVALTETCIGGTPKVWTFNGNAQLDTAIKKFGTAALLLDGTGDYITTSDHADFTLGSSDFTIDFWFNCTAVGGTVRRLIGQGDNAFTATNASFVVRRSAGNLMGHSIYSGSTDYGLNGTLQYTDAVNTGWHHYAMVRSGINMYLFIDGVLEASRADLSGISFNDSAFAFSIGRFGELSGSEWQGSIDEFRMSVGIARWTSAFVPPTAPYTTTLLGDGADPQLMVSFSDDGGQTWSPPRTASMGVVGQTKYRVVFNACGSFRQRTIKLRVSDPVKVSVVGVYADIEAGGH